MMNGLLQGVGTITCFIAFVAVVYWAYSRKNKQRFEDAAALPFADDELAKNTTDSRGEHNK